MAIQRRNTRQRKLVLDAVLASCDHPTAEEVYNAVRARDDKISRGTVYRNLNLLAEEGTILSIKAPGGVRFDRTVKPHAHVICLSCGEVVDAPSPVDPETEGRVAEATSYEIASHYTIFEGICPACRAAATPAPGNRAYRADA